MKKFLLASILVLYALFHIHTPPVVLADYNQAYSDYTFAYSNYRSAYNDYQVSKSSYLTYQTLTAQTDAIAKLRTVLKTRDAVMTAYYSLLQEKLNATPNISSDYQNTFHSIMQSESAWLTAHQTKIDAAATLDDLNSVSAEFESRYPQMDTESKQTIGTVLLTKQGNLKSQMDSIVTAFTAKLTEIGQSGEDTSVMQRDLIDTQNKLDLYQANFTKTQQTFFPPGGGTINLLQGQQNLTSTNQYLSEAETFLMEIVKMITG